MKNTITPAGFIIRFLAYCIDKALISLPFYLVGFYLILKSTSFTALVSQLFILFIFSVLLISIIFIMYQIVTTVYFGGSLGKRVFGLVVVDLDSQFLGIKKSLLRYVVGYSISRLVFGLGFFTIITDEQKRGWHDQIAETQVIYKEKERFLGIFLLVPLFVGIMLFWLTLLANVLFVFMS